MLAIIAGGRTDILINTAPSTQYVFASRG